MKKKMMKSERKRQEERGEKIKKYKRTTQEENIRQKNNKLKTKINSFMKYS